MSALIQATLGAILLVTPLIGLSKIDSPSGNYSLEKTHGYISLSYSHMGFSTPQVGFKDFDVELKLDSNNIEQSSINVSIDPKSIDSRVEEFNEHLNGARFFDTENHGEINFTSTKITLSENDRASIIGNLTIKGITKEVSMKATLNKEGQHPIRKKQTLGVNATAKINRSDWGLGYAVPMVSDEVNILISVELIKD